MEGFMEGLALDKVLTRGRLLKEGELGMSILTAFLRAK